MVWIVGKVLNAETSAWEFGGVFNTEQKAVDACYTEDYFIAEAEMDSVPPHESYDFPVSYYPHLETKEDGIKRMSIRWKNKNT